MNWSDTLWVTFGLVLAFLVGRSSRIVKLERDHAAKLDRAIVDRDDAERRCEIAHELAGKHLRTIVSIALRENADANELRQMAEKTVEELATQEFPAARESIQ